MASTSWRIILNNILGELYLNKYPVELILNNILGELYLNKYLGELYFK